LNKWLVKWLLLAKPIQNLQNVKNLLSLVDSQRSNKGLKHAQRIQILQAVIHSSTKFSLGSTLIPALALALAPAPAPAPMMPHPAVMAHKAAAMILDLVMLDLAVTLDLAMTMARKWLSPKLPKVALTTVKKVLLTPDPAVKELLLEVSHRFNPVETAIPDQPAPVAMTLAPVTMPIPLEKKNSLRFNPLKTAETMTMTIQLATAVMTIPLEKENSLRFNPLKTAMTMTMTIQLATAVMTMAPPPNEACFSILRD